MTLVLIVAVDFLVTFVALKIFVLFPFILNQSSTSLPSPNHCHAIAKQRLISFMQMITLNIYTVYLSSVRYFFFHSFCLSCLSFLWIGFIMMIRGRGDAAYGDEAYGNKCRFADVT